MTWNNGRRRRVDDERRITTTTLLDYRAANASEMVFCRAESVGRPVGHAQKPGDTHTHACAQARFNALDETRRRSSSHSVNQCGEFRARPPPTVGRARQRRQLYTKLYTYTPHDSLLQALQNYYYIDI